MFELRDIPGFDGAYQASSDGRIWSVPRIMRRHKGGYFMKPKITPSGYQQVHLAYKGTHKMRAVHRLVALAFHGNPQGFPCVNHIDGNRLNNSPSNLEFCSYSHNAKQGFINGIKFDPLHGRGRKTRRIPFSEIAIIRESIKLGKITQREIAQKYGLHSATVSKMARGLTYCLA